MAPKNEQDIGLAVENVDVVAEHPEVGDTMESIFTPLEVGEDCNFDEVVDDLPFDDIQEDEPFDGLFSEEGDFLPEEEFEVDEEDFQEDEEGTLFDDESEE